MGFNLARAKREAYEGIVDRLRAEDAVVKIGIVAVCRYSKYDALLQFAKKNGIEVLFTMDRGAESSIFITTSLPRSELRRLKEQRIQPYSLGTQE